MEIVMLGTSSMVPTRDRNHSAILLSYKDEKILVDCGEGTQRQFRKAGISPAKITKILLTHWHGDHILGLPGLMLTLGAFGYTGKTLEIYGPKGTKENVQKMFDFFIHRKIVNYKVIEVDQGLFFEDENFSLESTPLEHCIDARGYAFIEKDKRKIKMDILRKKGIKEGPIIKKLQSGIDIEYMGKKIKVKDVTEPIKGKKVTFVFDSKKCESAIKLAKNSDILICESTYLHDMKDIAKERGHMTAKEAAQIAKKAKVKKLVLTHFSQRYKDVEILEKEAKEIFQNTVAGKDLMKFVL
jgi:ribonuclease Z